MKKICKQCGDDYTGGLVDHCSERCAVRAEMASKKADNYYEIISLKLDDTWSKPYYRTSVELWGGDEELGDDIANYSLMEVLEPMEEKELVPTAHSVPIVDPDGYVYQVRKIKHKEDYEKLKADAEKRKKEAFERHALDGLENPSTTDNEFRIKVVEGVDILVWKDGDNGQWYLDGCSETFITVDEMFEKLKETI